MNVAEVNILGTVYQIELCTMEHDPILNDCDGYTDRTAHKIVVVDCKSVNGTISNPLWLERKVIRHEIIHAFLYESGLGNLAELDDNSPHNETMVDWLAIQLPKIHRALRDIFEIMDNYKNENIDVDYDCMKPELIYKYGLVISTDEQEDGE